MSRSLAAASSSGDPDAGAFANMMASEDRSANALAPLICQLRDLGVIGDEVEVETLLASARFDVSRAYDLYRDCHSGTLAKYLNDPVVDHDAASASKSTVSDRRRAKFHGGAVQLDEHNSEAFARGSRSVRNMPASLAGRDRKSSDCRVLQTGLEGLGAQEVVHYAAHGADFSVDVRAMLQRDSTTDQTVRVRRLKAGHWSAKRSSQKSNGWTPYPNELAAELERVYVGMLERVHGSRRIIQKKSGSLEDNGTDDVGPSEPAVAECTYPLTLSGLLEHESSSRCGEMGFEEVAAASRIALSEAASGPKMASAAAKLITVLSQRQGLRCTPDDARQAGLVIGSMAVLRAVLMSDPSMQLNGIEIFDRKFPGTKLNERGRKDSIRCLLARGMTLGQHAPTSKLLRKIEDDSVPLFASRFFAAMLRAFDFMPEQVVTRISMFLSEIYCKALLCGRLRAAAY